MWVPRPRHEVLIHAGCAGCAGCAGRLMFRTDDLLLHRCSPLSSANRVINVVITDELSPFPSPCIAGNIFMRFSTFTSAHANRYCKQLGHLSIGQAFYIMAIMVEQSQMMATLLLTLNQTAMACQLDGKTPTENHRWPIFRLLTRARVLFTTRWSCSTPATLHTPPQPSVPKRLGGSDGWLAL